MRSSARNAFATLLLILTLFSACCPVSAHSFSWWLSAFQELGQGPRTTGQADAVPYADADWDYWSNPGAMFPIEPSDTVAIGTDSPDTSYMLHVDGDALVTGDLTVEGALYAPVAITFDFDSGWRTISPGETKNVDHSLGGDPARYIVFVDGKSSDGGIHQANFGTCSYYQTLTNRWLGLEWFGLTSSRIKVTRGDHDDEAASTKDWKYFRVRILYNQ